MKKAVAKSFRYASIFGEAIFRNVPVLVDESVRVKLVDASKIEVTLSGKIVSVMEREVAKLWLAKKADPFHLTPKEIDAIRAICSLNQSEMAVMLRLTKGTISKSPSAQTHNEHSPRTSDRLFRCDFCNRVVISHCLKPVISDSFVF